MVTGDHDDRSAGAAQFLNSKINHVSTWPVRVEQIARDQQQVDVFLNGEIDDGAECLMIDMTMGVGMWIRDVAIEVKMHIRRM
jgi:hypothetical protein